MFPQKTADEDRGGIKKSMHNQTDGKAAIPLEPLSGLLNWAKQHPGFVLLGALAVAILAFNESPKTHDLEPDLSDEDVPLFI
jgi:hypothetical protein